jgi:hypothetical protein
MDDIETGVLAGGPYDGVPYRLPASSGEIALPDHWAQPSELGMAPIVRYRRRSAGVLAFVEEAS